MIKDILKKLLAPGGGLLVALVVYLQNRALLNSFFWEVWLSSRFLKIVLVIFLASFLILTALLVIYLLLPIIQADKAKKRGQQYGFGIFWTYEVVYDDYGSQTMQVFPRCPKHKVKLDEIGSDFATCLDCGLNKPYRMKDKKRTVTIIEAKRRMIRRFEQVNLVL